ncbi:hypothetical protein Tco_0653146 [Tanacetum coccineum]|uniref:Uncharacterized protein n=1 Tax=Tanacetum coccineum TaxID=301880 RepID=A0ABQ4WZK9_9ASTR
MKLLNMKLPSIVLKESFQSELGHIRDLEGDEEKLVDELYKLGSSFGVLFCPFDAAAKEERKRGDVAHFKTKNGVDICVRCLIVIAEQDSGNIDKTQSKVALNESSSSGTSSGSGPRRQETIRDTIAQTRSENVAKHSNDPLLARESQEARENKSRTHGLKRLYRVGSSRRVESSEDEGLGEEDASKQGRIADIDANEDIYLVNVQTDEDMFGVNDLDSDEVIVESVDVVKTVEETRSVVEVTAVTILVSAATTTTKITTITDVEITLAQALAELKSAKPKATTITTTPTLTTTTAATTITAVSTRPRVKGLVIHEQEQAPTPTVSS